MNQSDDLRASPTDEQTVIESELRSHIKVARARLYEVPDLERDSYNGYIEYLEGELRDIPARYQKQRARKELERYSTLWDQITDQDRDSLKDLLKSNLNEQPVHQFLEDNPKFLLQALSGGHGRYQISKRRLGAEYVPDFLIAEESSIGLEWYAVEIESPRIDAFRKNGLQSHKLTHAIGQIRDWRQWLRDNLNYARNPSGQSGLGLIGIDDRIAGLILIGRRSEYPERYNEFRRQMIDNERIIIHSYDWLVDLARNNRSGWLSQDLPRA